MASNFTREKITTNYFNYEKTGTQISVVGRLKKHIVYWESIGCSSYNLDVIRKGYVIPVLGEVLAADIRNNKSSREHPTLVRKSIELLQTGAVVECSTPPRVINPLTVSEKDGKLRLVIDLRHINKKLIKTKCKFEGHDTVLQYLKPESYITVFDLKSGYHHVEVVKTQHKLLGFSYEDHEGMRRFFKFVVLPFGLATAGLIFTKVLRELLKYWRCQKIQAAIFLDDGLPTNTHYRTTKQHALQIKGSLIEAGWVPHREKSCWEPKRVVTWLGFSLNMIKQKIFCTENRISKTQKLIKSALKMEKIHVKFLSKISGSITSMERSHGDIVFLFTKFMCLAIAEAISWNCLIQVNPAVREELLFWDENLDIENGMPIFVNTGLGQLSFSDASDHGCATVVMPCPRQEKIIVAREFNEQEKLTSSTERELLGVLHGLIACKEKLAGKSISWFTDNQNVARITKRGSMKAFLLNLALGIHKVAKENSIQLQVIWIPRYQNEEADFWSKVRDFDDWGIKAEWFQKICEYFKITATIDRFADGTNRKTTRFNLRFFHSQAEATDCFTQQWKGEINWVVPPVFLINRAIDYCKICQATMILVVPKWKSATFWPKLHDLMTSKYTVGQIEMGNIFIKGTTNSSVFGSDNWKGKSLALLVNYELI